MSKLTIKPATKGDLSAMLALVKELAAYEKLLDICKCDEKAYSEALFEKNYAHALVLECAGQMRGYGIYFYTIIQNK